MGFFVWWNFIVRACWSSVITRLRKSMSVRKVYVVLPRCLFFFFFFFFFVIEVECEGYRHSVASYRDKIILNNYPFPPFYFLLFILFSLSLNLSSRGMTARLRDHFVVLLISPKDRFFPVFPIMSVCLFDVPYATHAACSFTSVLWRASGPRLLPDTVYLRPIVVFSVLSFVRFCHFYVYPTLCTYTAVT